MKKQKKACRDYQLKKKLPAGPWQAEPDRKQWITAAGYDGLIIRNHMGALCGYVGVPWFHPAYKRNDDDIYELFPDIVPHGGLTFSRMCSKFKGLRVICHHGSNIAYKRVWWLGFDCAHVGDFVPEYLRLKEQYGGFSWIGGDIYRDINYVENEVEDLARSLRKGA